ncbi:hypothetical protein EYR41_009365 [Orbilia oligospora]|uniref:Uncharacterized protein n=1 Tax=Orbilia oligospora TaxID=2813651 RepID=A0A7C8K091_ORBOL|nr:hypothetical protein TWF751_001782 [Orbilia oligospora]KAF3294791.1 hypothetical protein TWF132_002724 [Orbilia oligospora]TGJ65391.1 hypothetical protein EYR41_009365 [Orbilia oligospora]
MAEHLTQDVDPRLVQSVVNSTTGADGVTTLSNAHGVEAAVVSGEESNANKGAVSSNGVVIESNTPNDSSIKDKRDDSPAGASGTESIKSADKSTAQKVAAPRKPPAVKSMSLNKAFLSGNASAAPTQTGNGKLTLSLDKGSKGTTSGTAATSASAAKPRLVSKIGPSGSRIGGIGQLGGKGGTIPSVWNRNQPPAPIPAKEYTDEELSKVGIHMAERLHTEDSKEAKWADIDDEDDNWVPPDTIEWNDGTKVTLDAETPKAAISAFEKQIGTAALKEQRALHASHSSPSIASASPSLPSKSLDQHVPRNPEFIPSMPPSKTPWAAVPSGQFPTPLPVAPPFGQYPGRPPPPNNRPMLVNTRSPKEVGLDDFNRQSWRDRQSSQSPSALFNSETGHFDPIGEANRSRDQARRNSRNEGPGVRPTSLLQRPGGKEHEHDMSFHHHTRFQRSDHDHFPASTAGPLDMGRRRSGSIRSTGLSDASSNAWDNRHPPASGNVVTISESGAADSTHQRPNQGPLYVSPGGDPRLHRLSTLGPQPTMPPSDAVAPVAIVPVAIAPGQEPIVTEPGENPVEAQKRVMRDAREQARARRLAEEAAAEEEKKLRIQKKLAELDEKMKADAASKTEKSQDAEVPVVENSSGANTGGQVAAVESTEKPDTSDTHKPPALNGNNMNGFKPQQQPQTQGLVQTTTTATQPLSPIQKHSNASHSLYPPAPPPAPAPSQNTNLPPPPTNSSSTSIQPSSPSLPFSFQPSNSFQASSHHQHQYQAPPNNFSQPSSSFNNSSHFHRYVEHPHPHSVTGHSQYPPASSSSHPLPPSRHYDNRNHHRPAPEQGNFHHPSSSRFASHPPSSSHPLSNQQTSNGSNQIPYPPVVSHQASSSSHQVSSHLPPHSVHLPHHPHPEFHEEMSQASSPMANAYSSVKVGDQITTSNASLPAPSQEKQQHPVEIPKDWQRNGVMKPSPWTPTAAETHVKSFSMFLPTNKDGQQPQGSQKATWAPNESKADASLGTPSRAPEELATKAPEKAQDAEVKPAKANAEATIIKLPEEPSISPPPTTKNEVDVRAIAATIPNLRTIARGPRGNDFVPGTRTTYKQLVWAVNMDSVSKGGDPRLDKGFDAFYAKEAKTMPTEVAPTSYNFGGSDEKEPKAIMQAKKPTADDERFDRVKSAIKGAAGGSWRDFALQDTDAAPRWREPTRSLGESKNWASWGRDAYNERRERAHREHEVSRAAWEKRQEAKRPQPQPCAPAAADTTLQVISKPAFQGATEGKPKVSLPRLASMPHPVPVQAAPAVVSQPELPNTLPTEEEFKEMAFQQEFGSTPTVCLPTTTRAFPGGVMSTPPANPQRRGKDKSRLRDHEIRSRAIFGPDDAEDGVPTTIRVKLPGMAEAKTFPVPPGYEAKLKGQHRHQNRGQYREPRSNSGGQPGRSGSGGRGSGSNRPRGPNQHGGRRGQNYNGPPHRTNA